MIPTLYLGIGCAILLGLYIWWRNGSAVPRCHQGCGLMRLYASYMHDDLAKCEYFYHCQKCGASRSEKPLALKKKDFYV